MKSLQTLTTRIAQIHTEVAQLYPLLEELELKKTKQQCSGWDTQRMTELNNLQNKLQKELSQEEKKEQRTLSAVRLQQ